MGWEGAGLVSFAFAADWMKLACWGRFGRCVEKLCRWAGIACLPWLKMVYPRLVPRGWMVRLSLMQFELDASLLLGIFTFEKRKMLMRFQREL